MHLQEVPVTKMPDRSVTRADGRPRRGAPKTSLLAIRLGILGTFLLVSCSTRHAAEDDAAVIAAPDAHVEDARTADAPDAVTVDADAAVEPDAGPMRDAWVPTDTYTREDDAFTPVDAAVGPGSPCDETVPCDATSYCDFERLYDCGALSSGTCVLRPAASSCSGPSRDVCGCDGMRYFNPCQANASGTDVQSVGPCP